MVLQGLFVLNRSPSSPLPRVNQQFPLSFLWLFFERLKAKSHVTVRRRLVLFASEC
jgi:hypothetical protein